MPTWMGLLLERLLKKQCVVGNKRDGRPGEGYDDAGELTWWWDHYQLPEDCGPIPVQSPHDPEATYSGHSESEIAHEVQVAETYHAG